MSRKKSHSAETIPLGKASLFNRRPSPETINLGKASLFNPRTLEPPPPKELIDYEKELTYYFYSAMLETIIQDWDITHSDTSDSVASGGEIIYSKPYHSHTSIQEESSKIFTPPLISRRSGHKKSRMTGKMSGRVRTSIDRRRSTSLESMLDFRKIKKSRRSSPKIKMKRSKYRLPSITSDLSSLIQVFDISKDGWLVPAVKETAEITFFNGNRYIGEMYQKTMHGIGKFIWRDGTTYTGDFKMGSITGKGRIEYPDKYVYEGEFLKGYKHGHGNEYRSHEYSSFNGEYYVSSKHGIGRMMYGINNYYEGPWNMNTREGTGLRLYPSSSKYYGDWVNGKRHGVGSSILKNVDFYHGTWHNGEKHGYGEYVWNAFLNENLCIPVQNKFCGMWDHDSMHGFGILYFGVEGGARYAGQFYKGIKHGAGLIVCNNGKVVKADPLFVNDKLVHINEEHQKSHTSVKSSATLLTKSVSGNLESNNSLKICTELTCTNQEPRIFHIMPHHKLKEQDFSKINNFIFPCYGYEKSTISLINQSALIFGNYSDVKYTAATIDLSSGEIIDLKKIINEVAAKYFYVCIDTDNKENMDNIKKRYFQEIKIWPCLLSQNFYEDYVFDRFNAYKQCDCFVIVEENHIRKAIRKHLSYLKSLYNYYAMVTCVIRNESYKPWLMRIYLWQLFMDCKLQYKNISLNDIDEMMAEYSAVAVDDIHNPFDVIYFWQFLMCLIVLAWKLYGDDFVNMQCGGILEKVFYKFLSNDIFPYARKHTGTALFEYRDVIPITAAYKWYKSFGPEFTVYEFLKSSSSIYKIPPPLFFLNFDANIPKIQYGENVAFVGDRILYRQVFAYVIDDIKYNYREVNANSHGFYLRSLKFLYLLGSRKVLNILKEICPMIAVENEYINTNHVLSFLEFYEAVLQCTQEKVNDEKKAEIENAVKKKRRTSKFESLFVRKNRKNRKSVRSSTKST